MTSLLLTLVVLLTVTGLFCWFHRLERTGRSVSVVLTVWMVVVVDAATYPGFDRPAGILHPTVGSLNFRVTEVLIVVALAARLAARGGPRRLPTAWLWWAGWAIWYALAGFFGLRAGSDSALVFFEAKAIIYLTGALVLAAGVPVADYLGDRGLPRLVRWTAPMAAVLILTAKAGVSINLDLPLTPLERLGEPGGDAVSVFAVLGVIAVLQGAVGRENRGSMLVRSVPLLLVPLVSDGRAGLAALGGSLAVCAFFYAVPRVHSLITITPTEVMLFSLLAAGLLLAPALGQATTEKATEFNPFGGELRSTFTSRAKVQSARSRQNQWREARQLISERPWLGAGLGVEYTHFEEGPDEFWKTNLTHDVPLDVVMRSGYIGLGLLGTALAVSLAGGVALAWRRGPPDPYVLALAVACVACAVGLLVKGLFESIFEKYLIVTTLGLVLGVLRSTLAAASPSVEVPGTSPTSPPLGTLTDRASDIRL
jgi:hypothetical protein